MKTDVFRTLVRPPGGQSKPPLPHACQGWHAWRAGPALALALTFMSTGLVLAAAPGTWTLTGSLADARQQHTATLLPNGMVLAAAGGTVGGPVPSLLPLVTTELYDPPTGAWTRVGSLSEARIGPTATLLPNGKVLVVGGFNGVTPATATADLYDPATRTWTPTASLSTPRTGHTATLLPNGEVLVAGGAGDCGSLMSAEVYNPTSGTWKPTGTMQTARQSHIATLLPNGKVLVAGGWFDAPTDCFGLHATLLASAELYDPDAGTWSSTGTMTSSRPQPASTLLANGQVLVAGGSTASGSLASAELYSPTRGTWMPTGSMNFARDFFTTTLLPDGRVLAAGGTNMPTLNPSAATELYDPASGAWSLAGSLNQARSRHAATLLLNGTVLVTGGDSSVGSQASAELYTPPTADVLPPGCTLSASGVDASGHVFIKVAARDILAGLQTVQVMQASNTSVSLPSFPPTFRDPAVVTATKLDPVQSSELTLQVTTTAGQRLVCDPVVAQLVRQRGQPHQEVFSHLPRAESKLTLTNGAPGLQAVDVLVNARVFRLDNLRNGETRTLSLASAMRPGSYNTVRVIDYGRLGSSAVLAISG